MWSRTWRAWSRSFASRSSSSFALSDSRYACPANLASTTTLFPPGSDTTSAGRIGGEGVEPRRELRVRALEQGGPLLGAFPLVGELHTQGRVAGAHDEPDDAGAEDETDEESDDHWADER